MRHAHQQSHTEHPVRRWTHLLPFFAPLLALGASLLAIAFLGPDASQAGSIAAVPPISTPSPAEAPYLAGYAALLPAVPHNSLDLSVPTSTQSAPPTSTSTATATSTATPTPTPTSTHTPTPTATDTGEPTAIPTSSVEGWWDSRWRARIKIEVGAASFARTDAIAEIPLNLTAKLFEAGLSGALDDAMLRLVETGASDAILDANVPFQFDKDGNYNASTYAVGELVLLAGGQTSAGQTRTFYLYFDTVDNANGKTPATVANRVFYDGSVPYEGLSSYKIRNQNATFYYHKDGGGFTSLVDSQGYDWITFHTTGGSAGNYRGIPNVATTDATVGLLGLFHPGYSGVNSVILNQGPLRFTIRSKTGAGAWQKTWAIYPWYARMNLFKKPDELPYWFLYEGTPGGAVDANDYYVMSDGTRRGIATSRNGDIPGEEWLYYGDDALSRVLYLVNHLEDDVVDCNYVMQDNMVVFGFGRDENESRQPHMLSQPGTFTLGFVENTNHAQVSAQLYSAYKPLQIALGSGQPVDD